MRLILARSGARARQGCSGVSVAATGASQRKGLSRNVLASAGSQARYREEIKNVFFCSCRSRGSSSILLHRFLDSSKDSSDFPLLFLDFPCCRCRHLEGNQNNPKNRKNPQKKNKMAPVMNYMDPSLLVSFLELPPRDTTEYRRRIMRRPWRRKKR